ncbi:MAG: YciI family protein [Sandaracinaceae bacterium]
MKFLMTYAANPDNPPPTPEKMAEIGAFTADNIAKGIVIMTGGLVRPTRGIHVRCQAGEFSTVDGPFAETKELIDGFALIKADSKEEAIRIAERFMKIAGDGEGEILQVFDMADEAPPRG